MNVNNKLNWDASFYESHPLIYQKYMIYYFYIEVEGKIQQLRPETKDLIFSVERLTESIQNKLQL